MPCPYSTLLGVRGQGVHSARIAGFALNDILATIIVAAITSFWYSIPFLYSLLGWFALGEVLHYVMCVDTAFLDLIGLH